MFDKAIQFLKDHKEIALATSEGNLPKLRIFQIMKQEGHVLYFATSACPKGSLSGVTPESQC